MFREKKGLVSREGESVPGIVTSLAEGTEVGVGGDKGN